MNKRNHKKKVALEDEDLTKEEEVKEEAERLSLDVTNVKHSVTHRLNV